MPEPTKQFIFSEKQIRIAMAAFTVGGLLLVLAIFFLATARPQGSFKPLDTAEFNQHVERGTERIADYQLMEDGRARLRIDRAIELVAERGTAVPGFELP